MTSYENVTVASNVYWVGVNDSNTKRFESLWEIPEGVSYNSYLVRGSEKTALVDSVRKNSTQEHTGKIRRIIDPSKIDFIVLNHMEPDHTGAVPSLLEAAPDAKVVLTPIALSIFKRYYQPEPKSIIVKGDEQISLGDKTLRFMQTPWLHWPETMSTYLEEDKILFSCDTFGSFTKLPTTAVMESEIPQIDQFIDRSSRKYFAAVFNGQKEWILKAQEKYQQLDVRILAPSHGPAYSTNAQKVMKNWTAWSKPVHSKKVVVAYGSMYDMTASCVGPVLEAIKEAGGQAVSFDLSEEAIVDVIAELPDASALIVGCPTYEHEVFPKVRDFLNILQVKKFSGLFTGVFGSFSWSGEAIAKVYEQLTNLGFKMVDKPVSIFGNPTHEDLEKVRTLAKNVAEKAFGQSNE